MLINSNFISWENRLEMTIIFDNLIEFVEKQKLLDRERPYDTPFDDKICEWYEKRYILTENKHHMKYRCDTVYTFDRVIVYIRFEDATKELEEAVKEYIKPTPNL